VAPGYAEHYGGDIPISGIGRDLQGINAVKLLNAVSWAVEHINLKVSSDPDHPCVAVNDTARLTTMPEKIGNEFYAHTIVAKIDVDTNTINLTVYSSTSGSQQAPASIPTSVFRALKRALTSKGS
jgi:hypothetical protein